MFHEYFLQGPSWLEELNSSFEDIHVASAPLSKVRSKSSYRILNSLPDYSLENSQVSGSSNTVLSLFRMLHHDDLSVPLPPVNMR